MPSLKDVLHAVTEGAAQAADAKDASAIHGRVAKFLRDWRKMQNVGVPELDKALGVLDAQQNSVGYLFLLCVVLCVCVCVCVALLWWS